MLTLKGITKKFREDFWKREVTVLKELSFTVDKGKVVGFLGANGAGKTTSLRIAMGFTKANGGEVIFDPELGSREREIRQNIGFLPERPYFYPDLTGRDFLSFMGNLCEMNSSQIGGAVAKWAPRFKIDFALDRKIKTYSKGMLQRIGFCSVLLHDPKLIILDEPLSGLDPLGRKELKDAIREVNREGKTVFFSSHIVPDVEEICEKVIFIEDGRLLYEGSIDSLMLDNGGSMYQIKLPRLQGGDFRWEGAEVEQSENYSIVTVAREQRSRLISDLVTKEIDIESIMPIRPSLEEIFYKVKNRERKIHQ